MMQRCQRPVIRPRQSQEFYLMWIFCSKASEWFFICTCTFWGKKNWIGTNFEWLSSNAGLNQCGFCWSPPPHALNYLKNWKLVPFRHKDFTHLDNLAFDLCAPVKWSIFSIQLKTDELLHMCQGHTWEYIVLVFHFFLFNKFFICLQFHFCLVLPVFLKSSCWTPVIYL